MVVTIEIEIDVDKDNFDKSELKYDILSGFTERTGYDIQYLSIQENEDS